MKRFSSLRSYTKPRAFGKNAFRPPREKTPGRCTWCLKWDGNLDRDHVLPRSLFPGLLRDAPPNKVLACRSCNRKRADGKLKPRFTLLPKRSQTFALSWWTPTRLRRHFTDVPEREQGMPID